MNNDLADLNLDEKYLSLAGGTLTGQEIWFKDGYSRVYGSSAAVQLENHDGTTKDSKNRTGIAIKHANTIDNCIQFFRTVDGTTNNYKIYTQQNITCGTSALTASSSELNSGCIYLCYS